MIECEEVLYQIDKQMIRCKNNRKEKLSRKAHPVLRRNDRVTAFIFDAANDSKVNPAVAPET